MGSLVTIPQGQVQQATEASPTTPLTKNAIQQRKQQFFGTPDFADMESSLISCWRTHMEDWAIPLRNILRETLRHIEYDKGNQYIAWDPFTFAYSPFNSLSAPGQLVGTQQGNDESNLYQGTTNIIQWLRRVFVSTIGSNVPGVEWWPGDTDSDLDNRASMARDRAWRKISSDNHDKDFLSQCLEQLFLTGSYFVHTNYSMDKTVTGTHYEDIMGWSDKTIAPDRYTCPNCGTDNPSNMQTMAQGGTNCMNCGAPLTSAHFHEAVSLKLPVVTGQREVANGEVRWNVYSSLSVKGMPQANTDGGGVIANTPLLDLERDVWKGAFRQMYPDAWDLGKSGSSDTSTPDSELSRIARYRERTPGYMAGMYLSQHTPTLHNVWFTPKAILAIDDKEKAQKLADIVKDGCCAVILNDKIIDIRASVLTKEWTWCGASKGKGMYPPAPVKPAMDFQDRINDRANGIDEYHDRAGCPPILFNQTIMGEELNGKFLPPGSLLGVAVQADMNRKLDDVFFQPEFHQDNAVYEWIDKLIQFVQILVGTTPQTYGGSDSNIKTATGQAQALRVAMGILNLYFDYICDEVAARANLSVDCFAENASDDTYNLTKSEVAPDFQKEPIRLSDLAGQADARPQANQNYPLSYEAQRDLYKELFVMASGKEPNPLVMEVLDTYESRRLAMKYLGPPGMELPETPFRYKVLNDLAALTADGAAPIPVQVPGQDPATGAPTVQTVMKPSIEPDPDFDDMDVLIETTIRYGIKQYKELKANQAALENIRAYLKLAVQYKMQKAATQQGGMNLLNTGAPGWGGDLGGPKETAAPAAPPQ